jgi:hypothetical protein
VTAMMEPEALAGLVLLDPTGAQGVWRVELVSASVAEGFVAGMPVGLFAVPPGDGWLTVAEMRKALLKHLGVTLQWQRAA